jgi:Zn-dependent protease
MWDPAFLIAFVPVLLFSLTFHEFAHAWSAYRLGDPTAAAMGRLNLNPLRHLDIFGTLVLVISGFRFGWAKPVPVNIFNFRDPKFGMFVSSAAGPASNILLALVFGLLLRVMGTGSFGSEGYSGAITQVLFWGLVMNLSLAFFNLIPVPPLDGSKILMGLGPESWEQPLMKFQQVGPMLLFGLIAIGFIAHVSPLWLLISPFVKFFAWLFAGISLGF